MNEEIFETFWKSIPVFGQKICAYFLLKMTNDSTMGLREIEARSQTPAKDFQRRG